MKFKVEITETLQKTVTVEAADINDAARKAKTLYGMGAVELDGCNLKRVEFIPLVDGVNE